MPVVLEEGFKFDLSNFYQIPIGNGLERDGMASP
jgi:hypothetical protein